MMGADFFLYAGVGLLSGFFAGLLGIGGGAIVASLLIVIFSGRPEFPESVLAHAAIGTALAIVACTSAPSAFAHARRGGVDWNVARLMTVGAVLGALLGALLAERAPSFFLKALLALFLLRSAAQMLAPKFAALNAGQSGRSDSMHDAKSGRMFAASLGIGGLSAMLGIGGGALTVPYLARRGMRMRFAIGTSAFLGFPLSAAAALVFIWRGGGSGIPDSWGFVHWPALAGVAVFSALSALLGAAATGKLPDAALRKIFGAVNLILALRLLASLY